MYNLETWNDKKLEAVEKAILKEKAARKQARKERYHEKSQEYLNDFISSVHTLQQNGYMVKFAGDYLDNDIDIDDIDFERLEAMQSGKKIKRPKQKPKKRRRK